MDDGWKVHARDDLGRAICGAPTRNEEARYEICHKFPVSPNGRCMLHGGRNTGHHRLKHGRYSKALSSSTLSAAYRAAVNDRSLLDLTEPIALLEACLQRTSERVGELDTPEFRQRALGLYEEARDASARGDADSFRQHMGELGRLLREGVQEDSALDDLANNAERLSKRLEAAWQIKLQRKQVLHITQVGALMARVLEIVKQEATGDTVHQIVQRMETEIMVLPRATERHEIEATDEQPSDS
jgi:hypothetical protein